MKRTIRVGIMTYTRADGYAGAFGQLGEEVDVHDDDLERFDRLNGVARTQEDDPQPNDAVSVSPADFDVDAAKVAELRDFAAAQGIDLAGAKAKDEIKAAIKAAQS